MRKEVSQDHNATHTVDAAHEIPRNSGGNHENLLSVKIRKADKYNDQTRDLLNNYMELMRVEDQEVIQDYYEELEEVVKKLENTRSSFRNFFLVIKYRRVSKQTYLVAKKASNRVIDNQLKDRMRAVTGSQDSPTAIIEPPSTTSNNSLTSPGASVLDDAADDDVERVEIISPLTGDPALRLEWHSRDQHLVPSLPSGPRDDPDASTIKTFNSVFGSPSEADVGG